MRRQSQNVIYLIGILTAAYLLAFIDRQVIGLLFEPLKRNLDLSDTQLSLLHGLPFALALAVASLPIGRLVDIHSRVLIVSCGVAIWSVMTIAFGLASGFAMLLLCRLGVAIGEAALTPAAHLMRGLVLGHLDLSHLAATLALVAMAIFFGILATFLMRRRLVT